MMERCTAQVVSNIMLSEGIYSMWLKFPQNIDISIAVSGQFISMYCHDGSRMLPRPISICEINVAKNMLRVVYRVVGKGTEEFSKLSTGGAISVIAPLGNGFTIDTDTHKKALLIGGGIGIPPMLELAKTLSANGVNVEVVLGYRDSNLFLKDEFTPYANVYVSTEDGSVGVKGNVIDVANEYNIKADIIYACGPLPMLRGIKAFAKAHGIKAQVSLEEKMACGIGACLGCVCASKERDEHSNVNNKRICKDGPVFDSEEVTF